MWRGGRIEEEKKGIKEKIRDKRRREDRKERG
jgi:hypothetical protein